MQTSYFGEIGNSFYAGPNGQSFKIRDEAQFSNKVQLDADVALGWASPIQPGEYALINYGFPNSDDRDQEGKNAYDRNREIDGNPSWNSTVWQKEYSSTQQRISYKLILSLQPVTPNITLIGEEIDPSSSPEVNIIGPTGSPEAPSYTIQIAKPWMIAQGVHTTFNPGESGLESEPVGTPIVHFNRKQLDISGDNSNTTYYLHTYLPKPWNVNITRGSDVNANSTSIWTETTGSSATTKSWQVRLPKPYQFELGETQICDPSVEPFVTRSNLTDGDTYIYTFTLPKVWDINIIEGSKLSANTSPRWSGPVTTTDTKTWTIQFPKAYDFAIDYTEENAGEVPSASIGSMSTGIERDTQHINIALPKPWDIAITQGQRVAANAAPDFRLISSDNDTKSYQIRLPRGYNIDVGTTVVAPNTSPSVSADSLSTSGDIDTQIFTFSLPSAWQIALSGNASLDANANPSLSGPVDDTSVASSATRTWTLNLPKSYLFTASTGAALNADANAIVSLGSLAADGRTLPLTFQFPAPWAIAASAIVQDPTFEPTVSTSDDHQTKTFTFNLPKAWQITAEKGATLAAGSEPTVSEVLVNSYTKKFVFSMPTTVAFLTGSGVPASVASDTYYINTANGDFYGHGDNNIPVKLFSFTPPTPDVATTVVNPYSQSGGSYTTVLPAVTGSQDSGTGKWIYSFTIPKMPTFSASTTTTGNGTLATITTGPSANDAYNFAFSIPKGTFWFTGNEFTISSPPTVQYAQTNNARNGDIYLNVDTGIMWKWNSTAWAVQSGTLKGPQGDGVEIVGKVFIDYHNSYIAAYKDGDPIPSAGDAGYVDGTTYYPAIYNETNLLVQTAEIVALLYPSGNEPDPDQIINIIGQDYRNTPTELLTPVYSSYWSYYLSPDWNVTPIGGGADSRLTWGFWDSSGLHR